MNAEPSSSVRAGLEDVDREDDTRPTWLLNRTEVKLLGIAGVGFFLDAYDLFIINPVATMLQYRLYGPKGTIPPNLQGFMKAGANIGSVIGQVGFGIAADTLGRRAVYGKELMIIILATILCITVPTGTLAPNSCIIYLGCFRILLGIGVGGDYPMSASVSSDRMSIRKRGTMLGYIFANQGWGSFVGAIVVMVVLQCYKHVMLDEGELSKVDGVWRICIGLALIPAFGTLYQRLTLPESRRYTKAKAIEDGLEPADAEKASSSSMHNKEKLDSASENSGAAQTEVQAAELEGAGGGAPVSAVARAKSAHFREWAIYYSEWRHAKILIGTCLSWFFLDVAFYGINLNQNIVLAEIGWAKKGVAPWESLWELGVGNLIITALGFVPGYYFTIFFLDKMGRKKIQLMGFAMTALFLGILAGRFESLPQGGFIACFTLLQFFFNFGANATTYIYPAEVFPTRFKAQSHGMSAASGKVGAIISSLVFNTLTESIGTPNVLWIFFGCSIAGIFTTMLLPEVKGRDADAIDRAEIAERRRAQGL